MTDINFSAIFFVLFCLVTTSSAQLDCPVITTTLGNISGIREQSVLGNSSFCSYRGIRYGQPPVGKLRFKAPLPVKPWEGTYNASNYGPSCMQPNLKSATSEDCLFLNVFVPDSSTCNGSTNFAVIVFIHGGGFIAGSSSDYNPHLLMNECAILVTINYRLRAFGFLPLALPEYSGNMGLKDQQLALKWIRDYIPAFGGNPQQVTLSGQSSGGTSVSFHRLNPESRSLIQRAYVMSNSALYSNCLTDNNNRTDLIVALAQYQGLTIVNSNQLILYLQAVNANLIINNNVVFLPCIEPETSIDPFISEDPEVILSSGINLPPTIYTYTSMEFIYLALDFIANPYKISYLDTNFTLTLPFQGIDQVACKDELAPIFSDIRLFFFGRATIDASQILPFIQLYSSSFVYFIQKEVALQAMSGVISDIRILRLNLRTELTLYLKYPGVAALDGCTHMDDLCSYFWCSALSQVYDEIEPQESLSQIGTLKSSKILREILTSFAITGDPVSETASFDSFPPVNSDPLNSLPFTELLSSNTLASGSNADHDEFKFWWGIDERIKEIEKMSCNQI